MNALEVEQVEFFVRFIGDVGLSQITDLLFQFGILGLTGTALLLAG